MNKQELEYQTRKWGTIIVVTLLLLVSLLPLLLRMLAGAPITPGPEGYLWLRYANNAQQGMIAYDPLHAAAIAPNPYTLLLVVFSLFGVPWMLPTILTAILLFLLYHYLERILRSVALVVLALCVIILSPAMTALSTTHQPLLLTLVLLVTVLLLLPKHWLLASVMLALGVITSPALGLLASAGLLGLFFLRKEYRQLWAGAAAALAGVLWYPLWTGHAPVLTELLLPRFSPGLFFELGAPGGLSVFFLILAVYGLVVRFGKDQQLMLATILVVIANLFLPSLTPVTSIALAVFVAHAVYFLLTTRWNLELLREVVLTLVGCIALFLLLTTVREQSMEQPSKEIAHVMIILRNQYHPGGVLTDPSYARLVEEYTGRSASVDERTRPEALQELLYNKSPEHLYSFLTETDTSYVLMTREMRTARFKRSDQGILFVLENSERFVKIEDTSETTLWYFIRK